MMALMDDEALAQVEGRWGMTLSYSALNAYAANYGINDFDGAGGSSIPGVEGLAARTQNLSGWLNFSSMRFAGPITEPISGTNAHGAWSYSGGMTVTGLSLNMGRVNATPGNSFMTIGIPTMAGALSVDGVKLGYNLANGTTGGLNQFGFYIQNLTPYANTALYIFANPVRTP
jgi:hypothetical protein